MSKKTYSYARKDHDRIWMDDNGNGPVLYMKKGTFTDSSYLTKNDVVLLFRVLARYLSKSFMLVPLEDIPAEDMPTVDEVPVGSAAQATADAAQVAAEIVSALTPVEQQQLEDLVAEAVERKHVVALQVPSIVSDPFGERLPRMLEAGTPS